MNRTAISCPVFQVVVGLAAMTLAAAATETKSPQTSTHGRRSTWVETMVAARDAYQASAAGQRKPKEPSPKTFTSDLLRGDTPARHISIDVSGAKYLRLLTRLEESPGNCHVWGDARLLEKDGRQTPLSALRLLSCSVGWGQLHLDENWQKQPLQIGQKKFQHGLWVHADSDLCYALDRKYQRFEAWIGLDAARPSGAARFSVGFDGPQSRPKAGEIPQEVRDFRHAMLLGLRGMKEFLAASPLVDLEEEWDCQYWTLKHDLRNRGQFARFASETHNAQSLLTAEDRDPADIVLRRTAALLQDLKRTSAEATLAVFDGQLAELREANGQIQPEDVDARYVLFADACRLRRQIAAQNPLLNFDRVLFVKHHRSSYNHMCDQYYGVTQRPGGGLFVLSHPLAATAQVRDVLAGSTVANGRLKGRKLEGGSFVTPSLSYDGQKALFAYVECNGDARQDIHTDPTRGHWSPGRAFHIFKTNLDGTKLEQLTDGTWNDFAPCWLPNESIAFITERRDGYLRCGRACPTYTLFDMAADGSDINCLSFHETNEWHPSVTNDGRIIYTRWDYVDRYGCIAHLPWITTLDGRDSRAVHGNFSPRQSRPDMEMNVRAIAGSQKFIATAAPHHGQAYGSLLLIDPRVEDPEDDAMEAVKRITPDVGFPESQGGTQSYGTAWPLSENYYLCVYDAQMELDPKSVGGRGDYGIYLLDAFGNKELLYRDAEIGCVSPIPVQTTQRQPVAPLEIKPEARINPSAQPAAAVKPAEGTLAVVNVYNSLKAWPEGTKIKQLRVYQVLPMTVPSGAPPHETAVRIAAAGDSVVVARNVLGTVPVEADGSAHFVAPANKELFFQALDERGLAVQSMRSATYLHEGEHLLCQGCHEPKHRSPTLLKLQPLALRRGPSHITPDVDGSNPFSYPRLVQPVLDRSCVDCHAKHADQAVNLGREPIQRHWYASYANLAPRYGFHDYGSGLVTIPGKFGARASKLIEILEKGHYGVKLSPEDFHRITLWLDSSSMFYGVYEKEGGEAQLRGEIARPTLQ